MPELDFDATLNTNNFDNGTEKMSKKFYDFERRVEKASDNLEKKFQAKVAKMNKGYSKGIQGLAKKTDDLQKHHEATTKKMEKNFLKRIDTMQKEYARDTKSMKAHADSLAKRIQNTGKQAESSGKKMQTAMAGAMGTAAMTSFLAKTIEVRGEFEKLTIAFETSLKSREKATKLMSEIVQMAATTPFSLLEVAKGAKQLMAFGESAETVLTTLSQMGDIAAGTGSDISGLNLAYGQVMTKGKLMTQEMYQFAERGVPIMAELAKVLQVDIKEISKMVETGKVGFRDVQQVMFNLTAEGGRFFELTAEQAKSLAGQYSNLGDAIDQAFNQIGESNQELLSAGISSAKYLVENWENLANVLGTVIAAYGTYKAAIMTTAAIQSGKEILKGITLMNRLRKATTLANAVQKSFNVTLLSNPYVLLATAIGAVAAGLYLFIDATNEAEEATKKLNEEITKSFAEQSAGLKKLEQQNKKAYLDKESINDIIKDLNENYGEYIGILKEDETTQVEVSNAIQKANSALESKITLEKTEQQLKERNIKLIELEKQALSDIEKQKVKQLQNQILAPGVKRSEAKTIDIGGSNVLVTSRTKQQIEAQRKLVESSQKAIDTIIADSANKQIETEKVKLNTIKDLEVEIANIRLLRNTKTDVTDTTRLNSLQAEIDEKQAQLDALNGKGGGQSALEALDIANQQRINAITDQYGREESLSHQFHLTLLQNELAYLQDKRKLTTDELQKLKLSEQIILKDTELTNLEDTSTVDSILAKYRTYYEKRAEITRKFTRDIVELERAGKTEQADVAKNEYRLELEALDKSFLAKSEAYQKYIHDTLPDIIKQGTEFLQGEAERLRVQIDIEGDDKKLLVLNAQLDEVQEKLDGVKKKSEKTGESFKKTISDLNRVNSLIGQIGDSLADSGSDTDILISGITGSVSGMINLTGAVKMLGSELTALEKASVILTVISATLQIANAINNAQEKAAEAKDESQARELQANYAINNALIEQIRLYERGNELFASDQWGTALNGLTAYNKALSDQDSILTEIEENAGVAREHAYSEQEYRTRENEREFKKDAQSRATQLERALASVKVTKEERSGFAKFFGAEDKVDQLIDVYPNLIDAQGKLNELQLEEVINKADISEADRQRLTNLQENLKLQEKSYAQFGEYIAGIFGGVGDDITQSFMDAYIQVADGATTMADASIDAMGRIEDAMSGMIENFTKDAIEFAMIQPIIDQLNQSAKDLGTQYASGVISSEALSSGIIGAIGDSYGQIKNIAPEVLKAYEAADRLAEKAGFDSAFNTRESSIDATSTQVATTPTATSQISQVITENTGTLISGRATALMLSNERLVNISLDMQTMGQVNMVTLNAIKVNTDYLPEIAANTKKAAERLGGL